MVKITFEYADAMSNWQWRKQVCFMESIKECIKLYGLGVDCNYRILKVEKVD